MRSAVVILSVVACVLAEAPYHLPRPGLQGPAFNYPTHPRPQAPALAPIQQLPAPQPQPSFGSESGYHYQQPQQQFVQQPQPQPQPHIQYQPQPQPQPQIQYQPQVQYQPQIQAQPLPVYQPQQVNYQQQAGYQYPQQQHHHHHHQAPQQLSIPSTSYGVPSQPLIAPSQPAFRPLPSFPAPQPQPQPQPQPLPQQLPQIPQPRPQPIVQYQQQQQGYNYQQPSQPLQLGSQLQLQSQGSSSGSGSLSSYQADSNQYQPQSQYRGEGLDSAVVEHVQNIIKETEHSSAKNAGYLSLVSGVSLENAKPSIEVSSFVQNSPLITHQNSEVESLNQGSGQASVSAPSSNYGLPSIGSSNLSSQGGSSFLPQNKPATSYGVPN